jgi:hypothetical protein
MATTTAPPATAAAPTIWVGPEARGKPAREALPAPVQGPRLRRRARRAGRRRGKRGLPDLAAAPVRDEVVERLAADAEAHASLLREHLLRVGLDPIDTGLVRIFEQQRPLLVRLERVATAAPLGASDHRRRKRRDEALTDELLERLRPLREQERELHERRAICLERFDAAGNAIVADVRAAAEEYWDRNLRAQRTTAAGLALPVPADPPSLAMPLPAAPTP